MLQEAAGKQEMELIRKTGDEMWVELAEQDYRLEGTYDFCLFWDKDVKLARALELSGLRVFNSASAIAACDDKAKTFLALKLHKDICMPRTYISPKKFHRDGLVSERFLQSIKEQLGFPCVVKECMGSFGQQVHLAHSEEELCSIIQEIGERDYMVQEYIQTSEGRDVRLQVVGKKVIASMYRYNDADFRANVTNGGSMRPIRPDEAWESMALAACEYLGLDFAGVDILYGEGEKPVLCEVNSNAHFKNLYACTGINAADEIMMYIKEEIAR